jgi:hypothetical protein
VSHSPTTSTVPLTETVQLAPSFALPIALVGLAIPLIWLQPWVAGIIALFGLFLFFQAVTLRLCFTETALNIYRGETGAFFGSIFPFFSISRK